MGSPLCQLNDPRVSILRTRIQYVTIEQDLNTYRFEYLQTKAVVLQGSTLGPLPFLIFIIELPSS